MSSYSKLILAPLLACTLNASSIYSDNRSDTLIMLALDYEMNNDISSSLIVYKKLFDETGKLEYLQKVISQSFLLKDFKTTAKYTKENLDKYTSEDERFYRLAVVSTLQELELDKALTIAKKLLSKYNNSTNYEVLANVYYARGEYEKSVEYFESAYASNQQAKTLISLADVLYVYLKQKQKAISYLETFLQDKGCEEGICNKLLVFYQEQQNIDGMISILRKAYKTYDNSDALLKVEKLLVSVLEVKDINLAIEFLEETKADDIRLLSLYERTRQYKKALYLVKKQYKKTKNKALLGQIAILRFEMAEDKKAVMKNVIANFELALQVTQNASYKNYYGYLLIDYDLDLKKGLKLVSEALESFPNNLAYLDSVAWGNYKLKKCEKAKGYMKKVIDQVGLENEEIKLHWDKIQECKK